MERYYHMIIGYQLSQRRLHISSDRCDDCFSSFRIEVLHRRNRSGVDLDFSSNKGFGIWKTGRQGKRLYIYFSKASLTCSGAQIVCIAEREDVLQS